jgi:hypothetical protein
VSILLYLFNSRELAEVGILRFSDVRTRDLMLHVQAIQRSIFKSNMLQKLI